MDDYLKDPIEIERRSFIQIRKLTEMEQFTEDQQQIVMRMVHTCGNPEITTDIRISEGAVTAGLVALQNVSSVLCDVEMVKQGLTKRFLQQDPLCFLNDEGIVEAARATGNSRTMTAIDRWKDHVDGSIAIIGNAPTALYRLMELIEGGMPPPGLVIGIPVGFIGAAESKDYLWKSHKTLGFECITVVGRTGGSAIAAAVFNTLVRLHRGLRF